MSKITFPAFLALVLLMPRVSHALPKPDLYPNQKLKTVSAVQADQDVSACEVQAQDYLSTRGDTSKAGAPVVKGAVRGAAVGALAGSITGAGAGRGAGAGAAVGGIHSGAGARRQRKDEASNGTPEYRKYMETCLDDKGYKVAGWR